MSSLRLALKQSLQESGQNASSTDWKKKNKKKSRLNMNHISEDRGTRESPVNNGGRSRHKRKGDNNDHEDKTNSNGYSSEENEFSAVEEEEEEEDESADENSEQDEEGQNDRINPNDNDIDQDHDGDDGGGTSDSSAHRNYKQSRKPSESVHDEHHKKQHSAANKIQSRWKRKHKSKTSDGYGNDDGDEEGSTDDNDEDTDRNKRRAQSSSDKTRHSTKGTDTNMKRSAPPRKEAISRNKQKQSGGSKAITTKSMTVVAPDPSIIQWMNDMPVKRCRQNIVPGMRVKVRFATKVVVRRKDSNAEDQESAPIKKQIVRKKKWFGGLVSAVSKEGSKIRIKYDDGTVEVTKFPDKDVVVDDNGNGDHQVVADCFIPPPPSPGSPPVSPPGSPPIGKKSSNILIGAEFASDLVDTPMQEHNINTMIDLKAAPKIVLQSSSDQLDDDRNQPSDDILALQPSPQSHVSNDEGDGTKIERTHVQINVDDDVEVSHDSPLGTDEKAAEDKLVDVEPFNQPDNKRSPSPESSHQQISMMSLPDNEIEISGVPHSDSLTQDDASVDTSSHPRRKRGRPPKHRDIDSSDYVPSVDAKLIVDDSTVDIASVAETKLDDDQIDDSKPPQSNKATLKIRIANVRAESEKSLKPLESVEERKDDEVDENHDIKRIKKKKKKARELQEVNQDHAPTSMKFQIQISSHGLTEEDASENVNNQQKVILSIKPMNTELEGAAENLKRKVTENIYPASLIESPGLSPRQRKKKQKLISIPEGIEIGSLELSPRIGVTDGTKTADTISSVTNTKSIRIKKTTANFPILPLISKKQKLVLYAKNSSNEPISSVLDNSVHDQLETSPSDDIKKDALETPSVRSGRRAAQQANERIASKQEQIITDQAGKKKKKKKDEENENVDSQVTDLLEDIKWVECDKCKKWRVIPSSVVDTLPNQWFCSDNIYDPKRAHCDVPQQTDKQVAKERKRKLKKQQQMLETESLLVVSSEAETDSAAKLTTSETKDVVAPVKEKIIERARSPLPEIHKEDSPIAKTKRESPVELAALSESGSEAQVHVKQERRLSSIGKKVKPQSDPFEKNPPTESVSEVVRRGRGRPRRNHGKELPLPGSNNGDGSKPEDDNVEWVKCDKCGKWRRLPSHISADDLPDLWYCEMNTWNPDAASCDEPGDTADGSQDIGGFGGMGGMGIGKLTYRNLIFGSTGRKQNRQVSERARAAESLFSVHHDEDEAPTRVLYADSCAFVSRGRPTLLPDDNEHKTVLELMGHSHMWTELRNAASSKYFDGNFRGYNDRKVCTSSFTFDTLPQDVVQPMKDMVLFFLGESIVSGEQLLSRGQAASVNNLSSDFEIAREFWNINVVVTTIAQLAKEGLIECVQKRLPDELIDANDSFFPYYRKVVTSSNRSTVSNESGDTMQSQNRSSCRCMKISKPWKVKANT